MQHTSYRHYCRTITMTGILFCLLLLTACATWTSSSPVNWQKRDHHVEQLRQWQTRGVLGIRTGQQSTTANFDWAQCGPRYRIHLFGPFGLGHVELLGDPQQITLLTADKKRYTARDPDQLLMQQLGFTLPVNNLYYWMRGLPAPGEKSDRQFDATHQLSVLRQQDWEIHYFSYQSIQNALMPLKIWATRGDLKTRIAIHEWQYTAQCR